MLEWKDVTSYSKGDTVRKPRVMECEITPGIKIRVHKHIAWEETLLLSSTDLDFDHLELGTSDFDEAKRRALSFAYERIRYIREMYVRALSAIEEDRKGW